ARGNRRRLCLPALRAVGRGFVADLRLPYARAARSRPRDGHARARSRIGRRAVPARERLEIGELRVGSWAHTERILAVASGAHELGDDGRDVLVADPQLQRVTPVGRRGLEPNVDDL